MISSFDGKTGPISGIQLNKPLGNEGAGLVNKAESQLPMKLKSITK